MPAINRALTTKTQHEKEEPDLQTLEGLLESLLPEWCSPQGHMRWDSWSVCARTHAQFYDQRLSSGVVSQMLSTVGFEIGSLSLVWNSQSRIGWAASKNQDLLVPFSPALAHTTVPGILTWFLGVKLRSAWVCKQSFYQLSHTYLQPQLLSQCCEGLNPRLEPNDFLIFAVLGLNLVHTRQPLYY